MAPSAREVFLDVNRRLNDRIQRLDQALRKGGAPAELVRETRATTQADLDALRYLPREEGAFGPEVDKVGGHLDLLLTLAESAGSAPALARKLLTHLLEEQMEITAAAERSLPIAGPAGSVSAAAPSSLPGDRRPLTVGSLIGR